MSTVFFPRGDRVEQPPSSRSRRPPRAEVDALVQARGVLGCMNERTLDAGTGRLRGSGRHWLARDDALCVCRATGDSRSVCEMTTRGVWQLRSLVISYCEHSGSSRGVREFLSNQLVPFATANPQLQIVAQLRRDRHPSVQGDYVTEDEKKKLSLKSLSAQQVEVQIQSLRDGRPIKLRKWAKPFRTSPSIQGPWEMGQELGSHRTIRSQD